MTQYRLFVVFLAAFLIGSAFGAEPLTFPPRDGTHLILPIAVKDGDTIEFYWLVRETRGRLYGINAPETRTRDLTEKAKGLAAKAYLASKLKLGEPCEVKVFGQEKYGGTLIEIFQGGESLNKLMIEAGHAKPYLP